MRLLAPLREAQRFYPLHQIKARQGKARSIKRGKSRMTDPRRELPPRQAGFPDFSAILASVFHTHLLFALSAPLGRLELLHLARPRRTVNLERVE